MNRRIDVNLQTMCALAESFDLESFPRESAQFISYSSGVDFGLKYNVDDEQHELFLTSRPNGVILVHSIRGHNADGIAFIQRHYFPVAAAQLDALHMLVPDDEVL